MAQYTILELINRAKAAADMHDEFVTEAQFIDWANVEHRALSLFLARSGYVQHMETANITANGGQIYTPAFSTDTGVGNESPVAILGVFELTGDNRYRRLRQSNLIDGRRGVQVGPASHFMMWTGADKDLNIEFYPQPSSGTYVVFYIPAPATRTVSTETVFYPMGWEEWIVLALARRALVKEEGDARMIVSEQRRIEQMIEENVWSRNLGESPKIRNVDRVERGWLPDLTWPPPVHEWVFP